MMPKTKDFLYYRSSRSSMGNYAHLLENNKNGDKGKHVNNGSRVQRDTISKVRVVHCYMYINILNCYCCLFPSFKCQIQKIALSFANNFCHTPNSQTIESLNRLTYYIQ